MGVKTAIRREKTRKWKRKREQSILSEIGVK